MAQSSLFKYYQWLVELIYRKKRITREEINREWSVSSVNDNNTSHIPERTFHRWKDAVGEAFGAYIECDKQNGNVYYISNLYELEHSTTFKWLLNALSVSNLIRDNKEIKDNIILEDIPSDTQFLSILMEAIRKGQVAQITYQKFNTPMPYTFELKPFCLRLFKRRWYVLGEASSHPDEIRIYSLDRIKNVVLLDQRYEIPDGFDAKLYFRNYYGICKNINIDAPQRIVLELVKEHADYFRTLPLHHSQREIDETDEYIYFEYHLVPTFDFFQELQSLGSAVRIIEPRYMAYWHKKEAEMIADFYPDITEDNNNLT